MSIEATTVRIKNIRTARKSAQRFHQFSCSLWCSSWWKHWHLPHVYIMVVPFGTSFPLGFMKNPCFTAVGIKKCMLNTLKKRYVFGMVSRFATAPAILFHHFNLRTVFAVISHTSAFRCMYRHCQALTYVMIIGLWLDRLPGNMFLQAFQHLSIVPVWASTFGHGALPL